MAHYALLDPDNVVVNVIVGKDEGNMDWEAYYSLRVGMACKRTSYSTRGGVHYNTETGEPSADQSKAFRKNYAIVGGKYDPERDAFIGPQRFPSWVLNEETCLYEAPVPMPDNEKVWDWNEDTKSWDLVFDPAAA